MRFKHEATQSHRPAEAKTGTSGKRAKLGERRHALHTYLFGAKKNIVNSFNPLHEAVILVSHLVLVAPKAAATVEPFVFEHRKDSP